MLVFEHQYPLQPALRTLNKQANVTRYLIVSISGSLDAMSSAISQPGLTVKPVVSRLTCIDGWGATASGTPSELL